MTDEREPSQASVVEEDIDLKHDDASDGQGVSQEAANDEDTTRDEGEADMDLSDEIADEVVGGQASVGDITITKTIDKSSPRLF